MVKTLRVLIHADPETIWNVLLDSIETPQHYLPDVNASSVVGRLEGGTAKELNISWENSVSGGFDYFVYYQGVPKEIKVQENENDYDPELFRSYVYEIEIIRENTLRGVPYREKFLVSNKFKDIRQKLVDHPDFSGQIIIKVVPYSVQNPMAPVVLQFNLVLVPKLTDVKGITGHEKEMESVIKTELQRIKERAEDLVRSA
ncbi:hypothetical protein [Oryzomonas rubra]|uniref:Polyketide cyclase / dehydrase and lipid transport n=1 Tax=Oryzomonas rubra TaxID=2509454 RepID=A0A5A9X7F4_9BACT|nr:hypothetical protein [Oryzomonas rubra]KAA0888315.1 hypothetical protein ET418_16385 [Oryzomonas rubra]